MKSFATGYFGSIIWKVLGASSTRNPPHQDLLCSHWLSSFSKYVPQSLMRSKIKMTDGVEWLFLSFPFLFFCLFLLSSLSLLVSWGLGCEKKIPSVLVSPEGWLEVDLYLIGMMSSSQLSLLSPLANREWNSKTILKTAKRVSESSQRQQPFPQETEETTLGWVWKVCPRPCIFTFFALCREDLCKRL